MEKLVTYTKWLNVPHRGNKNHIDLDHLVCFDYRPPSSEEGQGGEINIHLTTGNIVNLYFAYHAIDRFNTTLDQIKGYLGLDLY